MVWLQTSGSRCAFSILYTEYYFFASRQPPNVFLEDITKTAVPFMQKDGFKAALQNGFGVSGQSDTEKPWTVTQSKSLIFGRRVIGE